MLLILIALVHSSARAESIVWFRPWTDAAKLVAILETVPEGRAVLDRARKIDPQFAKKVAPGKGSYTQRDIIASARPDSVEPFAEATRISLRSGLPVSDAVTDLVHELVHFADRRMPDAYGKDFTVDRFVRDRIEGEGGELKAFATECRTAWSLEKENPAFPKHADCERYRKGAAFDSEAARLDYYAVGKARDQLPLALRAGIAELSEKPAVFTAGSDAKPYPVSLAAEFDRTLRTLCSLGRWRQKTLESMAKARGSTAKAEYPRQLETIEDFDRRRCR